MVNQKNMNFNDDFELFVIYRELLGMGLAEFEEREALLGGAVKINGKYEDELLNEIMEQAYYFAEQMEKHWHNAQVFLPPEQRDNVRFIFSR